MQERIIEIIIYLLGEFQQISNTGKYIDLSKELVSKGYTESEINLAFSWVFNHMQTETDLSPEFTHQPKSMHNLEKLVIAPEAYGYLLQIWHLGIIKEYEMEEVIERTLSLGNDTISLDDVKSMAATLIFSQDSYSGKSGYFNNNGANNIH